MFPYISNVSRSNQLDRAFASRIVESSCVFPVHISRYPNDRRSFFLDKCFVSKRKWTSPRVLQTPVELIRVCNKVAQFRLLFLVESAVMRNGRERAV